MNPAYSSIALAVFSLLSLFLYPSFLPNRSFADAPAVTPSITIGNSGSLAFSVDPGSFAYGSQDITVLTTNYTGYTLTAVPSSNDSRLANSVTGSYIESIEEDVTSSGFDANEYGFSTDTTITSSTTYHPVTTSTEIKRTNSATTTAQAGTFQLTIGAKAGSNTPAGTYTRTFTMTASANAVAYAVTYVENAGQDTVSNMPSPNPQTTGTVVGTTLTLSSTVPERAGYTFLGWDTNSSATTATYNAGGSYSLDQTTSNQITLYAIWQLNSLSGNFDGNGLTFANSSTQNTVYYDKSCESVSITNPQYSHTSNIDDNGVVSGDYAAGLATKDIVTIPGATKLRAEITYGNSEDDWWIADTLYVFRGEYDGTVNGGDEGDMYDTGYLQSYLLFDVENPTNTATLEIPGDTATFAFYSSEYSYNREYGYYAVITGLDANNQPLTSPTNICTLTKIAGNYQVPVTTGNQEFLGWSENPNATTPDYIDEPDVIKHFPGNIGQTKTLYAIWRTVISFDDAFAAAGKTKYNGYYKMQDMTDAICEAVTIDQTSTLIDTRDNQTYGVGKWKMAADSSSGACWMRDYLRLGHTSLTTDLTSDNTNLSSTISASTFSSWNVSGTISSASKTSPRFIDYYADPGGQIQDSTQIIDGHMIGVLYNYAAVSANTINTESTNTNKAVSSLCPKGWRLPTGTNAGELSQLINAYGFPNTSRIEPEKQNTPSFWDMWSLLTHKFGFVRSGYADWEDDWNSRMANRIMSGDYHIVSSVTSGNSNDRRYTLSMFMSGDSFIMKSDAGRGEGFSVSCIARQQTTSTLTVNYSPGVTDIKVGGTTIADGGTVQLIEGEPYEIDVTYDNGNYYFDGWTASSGTLATQSTSTYYAIGKNNATLTANSHLRPAHTLTVNYDSDVATITVNGNTLANGATISLKEGITYPISATFNENYTLDSWSISGTGSSIGSTTANPTSVTVGSSDVALTASSKLSCINSITGYMQEALAPSAYCDGATGTMTDRRDSTSYTVTKLADGYLWMTQNLSITASPIRNTDSNFGAGESDAVGLYNYTSQAYCRNDRHRILGCYYSYGGVVYYNIYAATAGRINARTTGDICPGGWHLPFQFLLEGNYYQSNGQLYDPSLDLLNTDIASFNPNSSGYLQYNSIGGFSFKNTDMGFWWITTSDATDGRVSVGKKDALRGGALYYDGSLDTTLGINGSSSTSDMLPIRCVKSY